MYTLMMSKHGKAENDLIKHYLDWKGIPYSEYYNPKELIKLNLAPGMVEHTAILMRLPDTCLYGFYNIVENT